MSVISALQRLSQEDHWEFNASLGYKVRPYLTKGGDGDDGGAVSFSASLSGIRL